MTTTRRIGFLLLLALFVSILAGRAAYAQQTKVITLLDNVTIPGSGAGCVINLDPIPMGKFKQVSFFGVSDSLNTVSLNTKWLLEPAKFTDPVPSLLGPFGLFNQNGQIPTSSSCLNNCKISGLFMAAQSFNCSGVPITVTLKALLSK